MLVLDGVDKRFGHIQALADVGLCVRPGQMVGFLGPNGAGKTTTMRVIMGLLSADRGTASWNGRAIASDTRQQFGYMPAERGMYPKMRVRDQLVYFARLAGLSSRDARLGADDWMQRLDIASRANDEVQTLSSGNQQRVQLAIALVHHPALLVLDEPFSGLDPVAVDTMKDVFTQQIQQGTAVLFSSHQLDLVSEICRDVVIIDSGRIVLTGDVDTLRQRSNVRFATVAFAYDTDWQPSLSGVEVVYRTPRSLRLQVSTGTSAADLLAQAGAGREVTQFSFAPPDLSEVFRSAVGAHKDRPLAV